TSLYAEEVPQEVYKLIADIETWAKDTTLIDTIKQQNMKAVSLDEIKKQDEVWMETSAVNDFMQLLMNNKAAQKLKGFEATKSYYLELFLMDNQGANVAMTDKTSDYWQGDEAKFQKTFAGQGAVHVGKVKFDDSSQAYLVQVSVPVIDGGVPIGALTVGVNLDELDKGL
ncbi:MAG: hypothetical protein ACN4GM_11575, partial [Gammaproteobacteria bacterium]